MGKTIFVNYRARIGFLFENRAILVKTNTRDLGVLFIIEVQANLGSDRPAPIGRNGYESFQDQSNVSSSSQHWMIGLNRHIQGIPRRIRHVMIQAFDHCSVSVHPVDLMDPSRRATA